MFNGFTTTTEETREYKIANPETRRKRREYNKLWRSNHKEYVRAYRKMYNAKRRLEKIKNEEATTVVKPIVLQEPQGELCARCGKYPRMQHRTICRECRNESKRKYYRDRKDPLWHPVNERLCRVVDTDVKVQIKDPIKVNMEAVPKTLKDYWLAIGLFILWITTVVVGVFR